MAKLVIGKVDDGWKHWMHLECEEVPTKKLHYAFVEMKDSMVAYTDASDRDIHHKVAVIFKRPWTGLLDGKPENTSKYIAQVRKLYNQGRFDQFLIAELVPGKDPVIHEHKDPQWLAEKLLAIQVLEAAEEAASKK